MSNITKRQTYWRDHVLAATAFDGTIVEYATQKPSADYRESAALVHHQKIEASGCLIRSFSPCVQVASA